MKTTFLLAISLSLSAAASANIITDGGFEGNAWFLVSGGANSQLAVTTEEALSGSHSLRMTGDGTSYDRIFQTVNAEIGQTYEVSLWVKNYGIDNDSIQIFWEDINTPIYASTPVGTGLESWQNITFQHTASLAQSNFVIEGYDNPGFYIDEVSIEAVPEPVTFAGLILLPLIARKRKSR